ncbi:integral membrane protein [Melanomma pulvis-pyrius CBS 109.77]|uniref:Integral membrane protein n=1 Tax=Melanomma pulvis-pyrius CBS 109.77 TaxID=1314802 RepID=A0A6A6XIK7_9PLEO|nr:integral membrane protein [Melanomma pulvis-pyrius CBS 109.77]
MQHSGKRSAAFHPSRQPLSHHPELELDHDRVKGPISFLNPTTAHFRPTVKPPKHVKRPSISAIAVVPSNLSSDNHDEQPPSPIAYKWTSRNNRKGRHALSLDLTFQPREAEHLAPRITTSLRETIRGISRMFTTFPIWDISYDVATIFTLGSVVWVINAFFVFLPLVQPSTEFGKEELYGGGITAFIGATIFELGSILLMLEAVNENKKGCIGWAIEQVFSHNTENGLGTGHFQASKLTCTHHHFNKGNLVGKGLNPTTSSSTSTSSSDSRSWVWFPSMAEFRTHYIHDLGFMASFAQLIGATIFWVSGFTALPGIYDHMSRPVIIIFYWTPQVLGGTGFIVSGTLFMLETQSKWYKPSFKTLGWWIGAWNLIGGIGFTLCPAFGYDERSWAQYQACLSTFWGSWAFLIGSVIQWYESLDKYPVEFDKSRQSDVKS